MNNGTCTCDPITLEAYCRAVEGHKTDLQVIGIVLGCVLVAAFCFWKARELV